jgi:hypothetical protein
VPIRAVLLLVVALVGGLIFSSAASSSHEPALRLAYTAAEKYESGAWMHGGERFPLGASIYVWQGGDPKKLLPDFFASADPDISFDGTRILFAGKKSATDSWQIWEVGIDGVGLRQLTSGKEDLSRPFYLPQNFFIYSRRHNGNFQIEKRALDGGSSLVLFHAPGSAVATDVLRDGRILFGSAYPMGGTIPEIYTVYSDGSGVESYRCDHGSARFEGRQIASGDIVFSKGHGLSRFTSPLAYEVPLDLPKGEYAGNVAESATGDWIVSRRAQPTSVFGLMLWNAAARSFRTLLLSKANLVEPRVIAPRIIPNLHPSALHDWPTTNLLALNVYTSKYSFPKDSVATVRLYTMSSSGTATVLGTAPVEKDGSFYIKAPGDQPLKFELLDKMGRTLKKQEGWTWARSGEQRICVGCHAGPERAPENAVPATLLRSTVPTDLSGSTADIKTGGH